MATQPRGTLYSRHRPWVLLAAALLPLLACLLIASSAGWVENTNAALVLVLVVVAAASTGSRLAGLVAAVSATVWFDFFLTVPYHRLTITDRADVETAVLLILVGAAVSELALWGRRQQARASSQEGYLDGILETVSAVGTRAVEPSELARLVADQLQRVLGLDSCAFTVQRAPGTAARLHRDGQVTRDDRPVDVERQGLPTDTEIELLVESGRTVHGRYLLVAVTSIRRPSAAQRRVAAALADQVGAAFAVHARQPTQPA